jgi:hypothetical protein
VSTPPQLVATPPRMRHAALLVVALTFLVGLLSAAEAFGLGSLDEYRQRVQADAQRFAFLGDPGLLAAANEAQMSALEGMKQSRGLVLGALAAACGVAFVSALRLLRPDGLSREGVRRVLVASLIVTAGLRTVDGAQWAVVAQRSMRAAVAHLMALDPLNGIPIPEPILQPLTLAGVLVHTAFVAGSLLLLAQYFRSEKVKQLVASQDRQLER